MKKLLGFAVFTLGVLSFLISSKQVLAQGFEPQRENFFKRHDFRELPHVPVCGKEDQGSVRCNARAVTDQKGQVITNTTPSGYGPAQLQGAYSLGGSASGNPIIAIVDAYGDSNIQSDLNQYSSTFGIPTLPPCKVSISGSLVPCFQKVDQNGGTHYPFTNSGWALETGLDVETAHAACPNCRILLVEAKSSSYDNLMTAVDRARLMGAKVVSNSYGSSEFPSETYFDSHFNYPGVAFTFSSGDSGYGTSYPAASKYVTAVGGTSLLVNPDNSYGGETVWNGAGSGCSSFEGKPAWQTDKLCSKRVVADVSADADPSTGAAIYDSVSYAGVRGWFQVGGTSLASPIIAATYAISGNYGSPANPANSLPYGFPAGLHDVLVGSNGSCGSYLCTAGAGYDGPTGMGTPNSTGAF